MHVVRTHGPDTSMIVDVKRPNIERIWIEGSGFFAWQIIRLMIASESFTLEICVRMCSLVQIFCGNVHIFRKFFRKYLLQINK